MIDFVSLASSSKGNAYVVTDGQTRLLLECGLTYKELQKRLDWRLSGMDGCLVTHEHNDHAKAVRQVIDSGVPVYMSEGTTLALNLDADHVHILTEKKTAAVGTFKILPFAVKHDAEEPLGFLLVSGTDKLLFATDTENIVYRFAGLTGIAIECNHDAARMDDTEPWVYRAKKNHMDIGRLCEYLRKTDLSKVRHIWLLHMSERHGNEAAFAGRIYREFGIPVTVCGA